MYLDYRKPLGVLLVIYMSAVSGSVLANNHSSLERRAALLPDNTCSPVMSKAVNAINNAKTISNWAANNYTIQDSPAFKHYFFPEDVGAVRSMFQAMRDVLYQWRGPSFYVRCGTAQNRNMCIDEQMVAVAFTGQTGIIALCDLFFTDLEDVRQDLEDKRYSRGRNGWCQPNQEYDFFQVAGEVILHELTHLNVVGMMAGLPLARGVHGTEDIYATGTRQDTQHFSGMPPWKGECTCPSYS